MELISHGSINKRMGDRAELRFMEKALEHGFELLKPWGDNSAFDIALILNSSENSRSPRLHRVQVRSTSTLAFGRYRIQAVFGAQKRAYKKGLIDFLAAYVIPCDAWYIVPSSVLLKRNNVYMRPQLSAVSSHLERYREAWHLFH